MLEEAITTLVKELQATRKSLDANTAALTGGKAATTGGTKAAADAGTKAAADAGTKHTAATVKAKAVEVKDTISPAVAKELIKATGAKDLEDLVSNKKAAWPAFMASADEKLNGGDEPDADEDEDAL